jgi:hypothetical protein
MNKIFDKAKNDIEKFLELFDNIDDPEVAKLLIDDDEKGLLTVLQTILKDIVLEYYTLFSADVNTDFLKRKV